jgi:prephenate dehydratase
LNSSQVISQSEFFAHCSGFLQVLLLLPLLVLLLVHHLTRLQDLARANDGLIERIVCWDGAGSPTLVKSLADASVACIASRHAASLCATTLRLFFAGSNTLFRYGLEVIAEGIGNLERQSTRYFIISRTPASEGDLSHSKDVKVTPTRQTASDIDYRDARAH